MSQTAARTGAVPNGFRHELGVYASDEEFRELICPFALGALSEGEPVLLAYDPERTALLREWLPESPHISYINDTIPYVTPARALDAWRRLVEDRLAAGAPRVRIAGNVPHPGYGRSYAGWDRYEAAIDRAWGDLPVWAPCLYDARVTPVDVLEQATRRHQHIVDRHGARGVNPSFVPGGRLADFLTPDADLLEAEPAVIVLVDPTPRAVRVGVAQAAGCLDAAQCADLVLAASEAVTNALVHGAPPVEVRIWVGEGRVVVAVHDHGDGPLDPLVGLFAVRDDAEFGRGMRLTHLLGVDVALIAAPDGFTLRLRAGIET